MLSVALHFPHQQGMLSAARRSIRSHFERSYGHYYRPSPQKRPSAMNNNKWSVLERPFRPQGFKERVQTKRKVALKVAYTGTGYYGSQKATDLPTIEGDLEKALYDAGMILESNYGFLEKIGWSRSSRTDKGVHSLCTVFGARLEGTWTRLNKGPEQYEYQIDEDCVHLPQKINSFLPEGIRVLAAAPVGHTWDARQSCIHRHYEYIVPMEVLKDSLYHTDRGLFAELLGMFVGRHHWHNFGQIEKKKFGIRSRKVQDMLKKLDDVDEQLEPSMTEGQSVESPAEESSLPPTQAEPLEPSLMSSAPRTDGNTVDHRSNLQVLDDYKNEMAQIKIQLQEITKPKDTKQVKPQFHEATVFNSSNPTDSSSTASLPSSDSEDKPVRMTQLTPAELAQMPLDAHLSQDAFFRTISSVGHDEVSIMGEKYLRISIQGDSFLLHQVRRMVGALILAARGLITPEVLLAAIDSPFRILTPRAPPHGLLLRDARFLDVDFDARDIIPGNDFAAEQVYPHMHHKWATMDTPTEDLEEDSDDIVTSKKHPWAEVDSMPPIANVRDIIPGFDEWLQWYEQDSKERMVKREQRKAYYEELESQSNRRPGAGYRVTTRNSF